MSLEDELIALKDKFKQTEDGFAELETKNLGKKFTKIKGASAVKSKLSKAARQLRPGKVKLEKALKEYDKAMVIFNDDKLWRLEAETKLRTALTGYLKVIANNIGARQQTKISRDQGLFLAKCNAGHRDLSLNF
jgi:exonuclease VII small subunit